MPEFAKNNDYGYSEEDDDYGPMTARDYFIAFGLGILIALSILTILVFIGASAR